MKKAEIWWANLNPTKGREQSGQRPVVVISGNAMNQNMPLSIVCPLSTKIKNFIGGVILDPNEINGLDAKSEILTFQIRTITHTRFDKKIGKVTQKEMKIIIEKINKIFKY